MARSRVCSRSLVTLCVGRKTERKKERKDGRKEGRKERAKDHSVAFGAYDIWVAAPSPAQQSDQQSKPRFPKHLIVSPFSTNKYCLFVNKKSVVSRRVASRLAVAFPLLMEQPSIVVVWILCRRIYFNIDQSVGCLVGWLVGSNQTRTNTPLWFYWICWSSLHEDLFKIDPHLFLSFFSRSLLTAELQQLCSDAMPIPQHTRSLITTTISINQPNIYYFHLKLT